MPRVGVATSNIYSLPTRTPPHTINPPKPDPTSQPDPTPSTQPNTTQPNPTFLNTTQRNPTRSLTRPHHRLGNQVKDALQGVHDDQLSQYIIADRDEDTGSIRILKTTSKSGVGAVGRMQARKQYE